MIKLKKMTRKLSPTARSKTPLTRPSKAILRHGTRIRFHGWRPSEPGLCGGKRSTASFNVINWFRVRGPGSKNWRPGCSRLGPTLNATHGKAKLASTQCVQLCSQRWKTFSMSTGRLRFGTGDRSRIAFASAFKLAGPPTSMQQARPTQHLYLKCPSTIASAWSHVFSLHHHHHLSRWTTKAIATTPRVAHPPLRWTTALPLCLTTT